MRKYSNSQLVNLNQRNVGSIMRVCVVNPNFIRSSGVTRVIRSLHQALSAMPEVEFYYVSCEESGEDADVAWISPQRLFRFNLMSANLGELLREWIRFNRWAKGMNFDVIHSHHRRLSMLLKLSPALRSIRHIYTAHLVYPFSLPFYLLAPEISCAIGPSVLQNLKDTTRSRVKTFVGNPFAFASHPATSRSAAPDKVPNAICVARFEPVKGHSFLLDAWGRMWASGVRARLLLVGEGSLEEQLRRQVASLGLDSSVEFCGYRSDAISLMAFCDFNILVSSIEGLPNVVIEAATARVPTLVTDVPGSRDCVPPNAALPNLVPFGNVEALVRALCAWTQSTAQLRQEEGMRFFCHLEKVYDAATVAKRYLRAYSASLDELALRQDSL